MTKQIFLKKWVMANTIGFLIGYLLYTPIAHGFTGSHGRELTTSQLIAHCVALGVVGLILFMFQKAVLKEFIKVDATKIIIAIIAFISLFWFGYYQSFIPDGPDYDILFSFLALGSGLWIRSLPFRKNEFKWLVALLSFPIGSFIGELIMFLVVTGLSLQVDVHTNIMHHSIFWISLGVGTGIFGGILSGPMLYKMFQKP